MKKLKFTLVELLVVISIIGVLAAMVLPMVAGSNKRTLALKAKTDVAAIKMAIEKYQSDNKGKLPVAGFFDSNGSLDEDFMDKYGRLTSRGYDVLTQLLSDVDITNDDALASNSDSELVENINNGSSSIKSTLKSVNPRHVAYLDVPQDFATNGLRDPWGNRYVIILDYETKSDLKYPKNNGATGGADAVMLDGKITHPAVTLSTATGAELVDKNLTPVIRQSVLVYSLGPDGADAGGLGSEYKGSFDDLNSWSSM